MVNETIMNADNNNPGKLNPAARRLARQYALQAMYQWQLADAAIKDIELDFLQNQINKPIDLEYFKVLLHGVPEQLTEIDQAIQPFTGRHFDEIDPIELGVLRLATFELLHRLDVPYRVVINEALELTKKYGSVEGYKFVNGVLDKVARSIRQTEVNMRAK